MTRAALVGHLAATTLLAAACAGPVPKEKPAPEPKDARVPLKSIHSTNGQKGLQGVKVAPDVPTGRDLEVLAREVRGGASNLLLVAGDDIAGAVNATRWALTTARRADRPSPPGDGPKPESFWLAAFLGIDSSDPPAWLVRSAERKGRVVRLSVERPERKSATKDKHHYFAWVPLGKLEAGSYTLELYDTESKQVTLMRRVTVGGR